MENIAVHILNILKKYKDSVIYYDIDFDYDLNNTIMSDIIEYIIHYKTNYRKIFNDIINDHSELVKSDIEKDIFTSINDYFEKNEINDVLLDHFYDYRVRSLFEKLINDNVLIVIYNPRDVESQIILFNWIRLYKSEICKKLYIEKKYFQLYNLLVNGFISNLIINAKHCNNNTKKLIFSIYNFDSDIFFDVETCNYIKLLTYT